MPAASKSLPAPHNATARWHLRLLGAVALTDPAGTTRRLPGRPATLLLAQLALWPQRDHPRETLIELLWPDAPLAVGRNRLRQLLPSLRRLLAEGGSAALLQADRTSVRLSTPTLGCDAVEFQALVRAGRHAEAQALFGGELLPGYYDDWVQDERSRLHALLEHSTQAAARLTLPLPPDRAQASLPSYLTRTFGLAGAVSDVQALVGQHRLVTLLGMGGIGKTRLAVEVASRLRGDTTGPFDRITFVPLATCNTSVEMVDTLAAALGTRHADPDPVSRLAAGLSGRQPLLVLDNVEQLAADAAPLLGALLARAPSLHLLVTSRRLLGLAGEQQFRLPGLTLPAADDDVDTAASSPALAMFLDRARAAGATLALQPRNLAGLRALVHALDGMPLAIELAAARARTSSLADLQRQFAAPAALRGPRHPSLQASLDWSWRLLDGPQQQALAALSVFEGPFTASMAQALIDDGHADPLMADLAGQSLLRVLPDDPDGLSAVRFALPEAVREFAAEHLGEQRQARLRRRLRDWLLAWARALGRLPSPRQVEPCIAAVRAVLSRAAGAGEGQAAWALALALRSHWDTDALPLHCIQALEAGLAQLVDDGQRADAYELLAYLRFEAGFAEQAWAHAEQAVRAAGDDRVRQARAQVRRLWIQVARSRGAETDPTQVEQTLALTLASGDLESQARALHQQAFVVNIGAGGPWAAEPLLARAQALWLQLGDTRKAMARLRNRAQCWQEMGRPEQAMASFVACERAAWVDGDWLGVIDTAISRGALLARQRRWADAAAAYRLCIDVAARREHLHALAYGLWFQCRVLARLRRPQSAAQLMAYAAHFWASRFGALGPIEQRYMRRIRGLVQAQASLADAELWTIEGRQLDLRGAVQLALSPP